jgi:hypothetical protein
VTLTDGQLDKVTAGDAASQTAFLVGVSTVELNRLVSLSNFAVGLLNGFPMAPLPTTTPSLPNTLSFPVTP